MIIFLDTNILLDLLLSARENHQRSHAILKATKAGQVESRISVISIVNAIYVMRHAMSQAEIGRYMFNIAQTIKVVPTGNSALLAALSSGWPDLEDAIQFHTAMESGQIDHIITSDAHFKVQKSISVKTPKQFLELLVV